MVVDRSFLRDAHELVVVIRVGSGGNDPGLGGIMIFDHAKIETLLFAIDRERGGYKFEPFVIGARKLFERVGVVGESTQVITRFGGEGIARFAEPHATASFAPLLFVVRVGLVCMLHEGRRSVDLAIGIGDDYVHFTGWSATLP